MSLTCKILLVMNGFQCILNFSVQENLGDSITEINEMSLYLLLKLCEIPHNVAQVYE